MSRAYYNEHDPYAAAWLRALIADGQITEGDVDERSIEDVVPSELVGYGQCHFFAGIGGWSLALRLAGWPDDRPVWTGSCPCQPFSSAGKGAGFADERHLWPAWHWLITQCRPQRIYGEQVASGPGLVWLDLVSTDLEALVYAITAVDLPSASVGATDIRQRLFWMADTDDAKRRADRAARHDGDGAAPRRLEGDGDTVECGSARGLADTPDSKRRRRIPGDHWTASGDDRCGCWDPGAFHRTHGMLPGEACTNTGRMGDASGARGGRHAGAISRSEASSPGERVAAWCFADESESTGVPGRVADTNVVEPGDGRIQRGWRLVQLAEDASTRHAWSDVDWLPCRDGKFRPVEPGTFPLVARLPQGVGSGRAALEARASLPREAQGSRVGRLRGYGNAINPWSRRRSSARPRKSEDAA